MSGKVPPKKLEEIKELCISQDGSTNKLESMITLYLKRPEVVDGLISSSREREQMNTKTYQFLFDFLEITKMSRNLQRIRKVRTLLQSKSADIRIFFVGVPSGKEKSSGGIEKLMKILFHLKAKVYSVRKSMSSKEFGYIVDVLYCLYYCMYVEIGMIQVLANRTLLKELFHILEKFHNITIRNAVLKIFTLSTSRKENKKTYINFLRSVTLILPTSTQKEFLRSLFYHIPSIPSTPSQKIYLYHCLVFVNSFIVATIEENLWDLEEKFDLVLSTEQVLKSIVRGKKRLIEIIRKDENLDKQVKVLQTLQKNLILSLEKKKKEEEEEANNPLLKRPAPPSNLARAAEIAKTLPAGFDRKSYKPSPLNRQSEKIEEVWMKLCQKIYHYNNRKDTSDQQKVEYIQSLLSESFQASRVLAFLDTEEVVKTEELPNEDDNEWLFITKEERDIDHTIKLRNNDDDENIHISDSDEEEEEEEEDLRELKRRKKKILENRKLKSMSIEDLKYKMNQNLRKKVPRRPPIRPPPRRRRKGKGKTKNKKMEISMIEDHQKLRMLSENGCDGNEEIPITPSDSRIGENVFTTLVECRTSLAVTSKTRNGIFKKLDLEEENEGEDDDDDDEEEEIKNKEEEEIRIILPIGYKNKEFGQTKNRKSLKNSVVPHFSDPDPLDLPPLPENNSNIIKSSIPVQSNLPGSNPSPAPPPPPPPGMGSPPPPPPGMGGSGGPPPPPPMMMGVSSKYKFLRLNAISREKFHLSVFNDPHLRLNTMNQGHFRDAFEKHFLKKEKKKKKVVIQKKKEPKKIKLIEKVDQSEIFISSLRRKFKDLGKFYRCVYDRDDSEISQVHLDNILNAFPGDDEWKGIIKYPDNLSENTLDRSSLFYFKLSRLMMYPKLRTTDIKERLFCWNEQKQFGEQFKFFVTKFTKFKDALYILAADQNFIVFLQYVLELSHQFGKTRISGFELIPTFEILTVEKGREKMSLLKDLVEYVYNTGSFQALGFISEFLKFEDVKDEDFEKIEDDWNKFLGSVNIMKKNIDMIGGNLQKEGMGIDKDPFFKKLKKNYNEIQRNLGRLGLLRKQIDTLFSRNANSFCISLKDLKNGEFFTKCYFFTNKCKEALKKVKISRRIQRTKSLKKSGSIGEVVGNKMEKGEIFHDYLK